MPVVWLRRISTAIALAASVAAPALGQQGPKSVGTLALETQSVPRIYTVPGRAVAYEQAGIRPRVTGIIREILYKPGTAITAGTPMFRLDTETYEASVAQAEANVASSRAAVTQADAAYDRAQRLVGSGSTQVDLESALATLEQARASLQSSEAALTLAQIELSWTTVTSPIDGMASVADITVGALVSANQADSLATVIRLDPIEVDMYEPSGRIQRVRDDMASGRLRLNDKLLAHLTLENGDTYSGAGEFVAPGFSVSTTTGTIDFRFRFANPDARILPGMFVRGQVELGQFDALLVPQSAATRGRDGQLTAWVIEDGKAAQRKLTEDGVHQNAWIITEGVAEGDQLIIDGFSGLTVGAEVAPIAATIDENGVVRDAAPAAAE